MALCRTGCFGAAFVAVCFGAWADAVCLGTNLWTDVAPFWTEVAVWGG